MQENTDPARPVVRAGAVRLVLALAAGAAVAFAAWRWATTFGGRPVRAAEMPRDRAGSALPRTGTPASPWQGLALEKHAVDREPRLRPAAEAGLPDDAEVVGVEAGGRSRAYVLGALAPPDRHVLNDRLGGLPVTVTYCPRDGCLRVFTGPKGGGPLAVSVGGWDGRSDPGSMLLRVADERYRQDKGLRLGREPAPFPYPTHEFVRTTWRRWREAHPDTDVHVGASPAGEYPPPDRHDG